MANSDLTRAVEDAQRLLQYASVKGIELEKDLVSEVVEARALISIDENDSSTFEAQKKFWHAQNRLANATSPASIESIRFATTARTPWTSRLWAFLSRTPAEPVRVGELAVSRANLIAVVWLLVVLALTAYSETASTTLKSYSLNHEKYERNARTLLLEAPSAPSPEVITNLKLENQLLREETSRQLKIMGDWLFWKSFPKADSPERTTAVLATTEWTLVVLRGSLLPVIWGVIGAALYVLRTLATDLASMSYSRDHATLHRSRYYLGAVAGFVVAKFSTILSGKVIDDAIQPMVLALLVGYSVDVLFNLLNKMIEVFTPKGDPARKPTGK